MRELTAEMKRSALIAALRDKSLWPTDFLWDFWDCMTCAMGLATQMLGVQKARTDHMAQALGITADDAIHLFCPMRYTDWRNKFNYPAGVPVTPEMVADRLAELHERMKER
jgi:hypothetical protein